MVLKGSKKVEGGKLVKVKLEKDGRNFSNVSVTGDFFLQPPEALEEMEREIEETDSENLNDLSSDLNNLDAEMIGFSPEDVVEAVKDALGDER